MKTAGVCIERDKQVSTAEPAAAIICVFAIGVLTRERVVQGTRRNAGRGADGHRSKNGGGNSACRDKRTHARNCEHRDTETGTKFAAAQEESIPDMIVEVAPAGTLATWAGEQLGWRASFWGIAALGVVTRAALRPMLSLLPAPESGDSRAERRVLARGNVLTTLSLTAIGSSATLTVFTYIAQILREMTRASLGYVTTMLVVYGLALTGAIGSAGATLTAQSTAP